MTWRRDYSDSHKAREHNETASHGEPPAGASASFARRYSIPRIGRFVVRDTYEDGSLRVRLFLYVKVRQGFSRPISANKANRSLSPEWGLLGGVPGGSSANRK